MSVEDHRAAARQSVSCAIITVSDSRTEATDRSGDAIAALLLAAGYVVASRTVVPDDPSAIVAAVQLALENPAIHAVITTGGTGVAHRDSTPEAVGPLIEKPLAGFGELFRLLSFAEIGSAAMVSRALAGTSGRKAIFVLPGSEPAARLALNRLIVPELGHILAELAR